MRSARQPRHQTHKKKKKNTHTHTDTQLQKEKRTHTKIRSQKKKKTPPETEKHTHTQTVVGVQYCARMQRDGNTRDERMKRRKKRLFSRVVLPLSLSILCKSIISRGPRRVGCVLCSSPSQTTLYSKNKRGQKGYGAAIAAAAACKPQAVFDRS
jgi:hypothetical protein